MEPEPSYTSPLQRVQTAWRWAIRPSVVGWSVPPLLALILLLAFLVRIYGVEWDQNGLFHPDERSVYLRTDCMYRLLVESPGWESCTAHDPFRQIEPGFPSLTVFLDADRSPLNPHWFPLGSIILYVLVGIKLLASPFLTMEFRDLAIAGRLLSTLADVGTVAMVYLLGKRLYSRNAGLLAAALVAFAVVHIQHSHYYRPETFSNLFTLASFWFMLQVLEKNRLRDSALLGLFIGLAFSTKISMAPILLPLAALYGRMFIGALRNPAPITGTDPPDRPALLEKAALRALLGGFIAIAVYLFWTPYSILAFPEFLFWNLRELDIVRNAGSVPYTVQYIGAPKLLYELRADRHLGTGVSLSASLAWGGFLAAIVINLRRPRWGQVLILLWAVPLHHHRDQGRREVPALHLPADAGHHHDGRRNGADGNRLAEAAQTGDAQGVADSACSDTGSNRLLRPGVPVRLFQSAHRSSGVAVDQRQHTRGVVHPHRQPLGRGHSALGPLSPGTDPHLRRGCHTENKLDGG